MRLRIRSAATSSGPVRMPTGCRSRHAIWSNSCAGSSREGGCRLFHPGGFIAMRIPCVQEVIDALLEPAGMRIEPTADTLKFGRPHTEVTGIATAFMPTQAVLEEAAGRGADRVIVHERRWYS